MSAVTNITEKHRRIMEAIQEHPATALFSCFYEGKPACAIVLVIPAEDGSFEITPVALMLTEEMKDKLTDHEGKVPSEDDTEAT